MQRKRVVPKERRKVAKRKVDLLVCVQLHVSGADPGFQEGGV